MMKWFLVLMATLCLALPVTAGEDDIGVAAAKWSLGTHRSPENIARNKSRHPAATLAFFGLKEDMRVIEISPGGGWYMEILAPLLREKGTYVAATYDPNSENERVQARYKSHMEKLAAHPDIYDKVENGIFANGKFEVGEPGTADMVLTFRNIHNWMNAGHITPILNAFNQALKPGGILGVVEHSGHPDKTQDPKGGSGYVTEQYMIKLAEHAGFILVGRSDINANPMDSTDHPNGVWSLPPTLYKMETEEEKAPYRAIGESNRFTLKFVKP